MPQKRAKEKKEPNKHRSSKWVFADTKTNISKQVWFIGQAYLERARATEKGKKIRHKNGYPILLAKLFYITYLRGSKLMDTIKKPFSINTVNTENLSWIEIKEKEHEETIQVFPIFHTNSPDDSNEYEQLMWNLITSGGTIRTSKEIFHFNEWKSLKKENISGLLKRNFKCNLKDTEGKLHRNAQITPTILRSMREFSVVFNYNVRDVDLLIQWFQWADARPLYYYTHVKEKLDSNPKMQLDRLKNANLLTNLPIDFGKAISDY